MDEDSYDTENSRSKISKKGKKGDTSMLEPVLSKRGSPTVAGQLSAK
jgi:hypothetical protein